MMLKIFNAFGAKGFDEIEEEINSWLNTREGDPEFVLHRSRLGVSTVGDAPGELYQCIVCEIWYDYSRTAEDDAK